MFYLSLPMYRSTTWQTITMPSLSGNISAIGALVEVRLTPIPRWGVPVTGMGLIDTGATTSNIDVRAVTSGRFRVTGYTNRISANLTAKAKVYQGYLELLGLPPHRALVDLIEIDQLDKLSAHAGINIIGLVGLDILNNTLFTYDGPNKGFTLDIP